MIQSGWLTEQPKTWGENLADIFGGIRAGIGGVREITTMADELFRDIGIDVGLRQPQSEGPREVGNSRGLVQDVQNIVDRGAETVKGWGTAFMDQAKGLFNLGFGQTGSQPAFAIKHELAPSPKTTIGIVVIIGIVLIVIMLGRKK